MRTQFETYVADRWVHNPLKQRGGIGDEGHPVPFPLVAALGLPGETGEVVELLKKHFRDGKHPGEALKLELGDVLHYLIVIAQSYGWTLDDLTCANVCKLVARDQGA